MSELFNAPLDLDRPIKEMWDAATTIDADADNAIRIWAGPQTMLLRGHTGTDFDPDLGVQATLSLAETHLRKLSQLGAFVISRAYEATEAAQKLGMGLTSEASVPLALSAVPYTNHLVKLDTVMRPDAAMIAARLEPEVLTPLEKYLAWCSDSHSSHMLADIYTPRQYSYHYETQHIFLHDIDPLVDRADEDMLEASWQRLKQFSELSRN